jgi:sulfate adenylyltransferase
MDGSRRIHAVSLSHLNSPYGDTLTELLVTRERARELKTASRDFPSIDLTAREFADLEMLATGAFSPLTTFMSRADYESVCVNQRLADGRLWPLPVVLEAAPKLAESLATGARVALRDVEGTMIAVLTVAEVFERDRKREAELVFGAGSGNHPDAAYLLKREGHVCLSGQLEVVELPVHHDFTAFRHLPEFVRAAHTANDARNLVGYIPQYLLHRTHVEFARRVALSRSAQLLVLAPTGRRLLEEPTHYSRVRAYIAAIEQCPPGLATLNVLPHSARMAGARGALLNAIVARNFGCTQLIVEHDCIELGEGATGEPCYGQYSVIETLERHSAELGVEIVPFRNLVHEEDRPERLLLGRYLPPGADGPEAARLREVARLFTYPRVMHEYQKRRANAERGFTVFFTGLSGAGKSTIARIFEARLMERGDRQTTMLDGDVVRKHLSSELSFSREHRDLNVMRLGYIASLVTQHHGIAICAPIAPYAATRAAARAMVQPHGAFVEVYVATPLSTCEARDRKGLYARARQGLIPQFTGISDPYEPPEHAEIVINTDEVSAGDAAQMILDYLAREQLLPPLAAEPATREAGSHAERPAWASSGVDMSTRDALER